MAKPITISKSAAKTSAQVPSFSAQIVVRDLNASVDFYKKAFGFKEISPGIASSGAYSRDQVRALECNGLPFLLISEQASESLEGYNAQSPISLNTLSSTIITVLCRDIQAMYERAINAGARPIQAPHRTNGGAKTFLVTGIENYVWRFVDTFSSLSEAL